MGSSSLRQMDYVCRAFAGSTPALTTTSVCCRGTKLGNRGYGVRALNLGFGLGFRVFEGFEIKGSFAGIWSLVGF